MREITDPIRNFQRFISARQRRGKTAVEIRDEIMSHDYDLHSAADAVAEYWDDRLVENKDE